MGLLDLAAVVTEGYRYSLQVCVGCARQSNAFVASTWGSYNGRYCTLTPLHHGDHDPLLTQHKRTQRE